MPGLEGPEADGLARGAVSRRAALAVAVGLAAAGAGAAAAGFSSKGTGLQAVGPLPTLLTTSGYRRDVVVDGYGRDGWEYGNGVTLSNRQWIDRGRVPGRETRWEDMAYWALVDLKCLMVGNGAVAAGAAAKWGYTWSRDSAFAVAAMVRAGHRAEALQVLAFMRYVQLPGGGFHPRDLLSGGAPDNRSTQSDGAGWALWAVAQLLAVAPDPAADQLDTHGAPTIAATAAAELQEWLPMVDRAVMFIAADLRTGRGLPTPSSDYWERRETKLTLGTAAVLLLGLRSAAAIYREVGQGARAGRAASDAADELQGRVDAAFGPGGYQRYAGSGGQDAAVCWLLPPFTDQVRGTVVDAWHAYQQDAARPGGGLAPGVGWKRDGVSWTPEVAQVALTAAASGMPKVAHRWLDWLDASRTSWGSLPEKVRPDRAPAGPAPLGWTASTVLLTLEALDNA